jgi:thymidylate synthase (FAD)
MRLIKPSVDFIWATKEPLRTIEQAGRICYKSEDKITDESAPKFVKRLLDRGHEAMIEHASASYRVICDRGVTHEIVRHRLFSYAQESTRYCNYKGEVTYIIPPWMSSLSLHNDNLYWEEIYSKESYEAQWLRHLSSCEIAYQDAIEAGWIPQQARSVLPNALKTEIVITGNLREWRHFFKLRCAKSAHPQMQEVANMVLDDIRKRISVIFEGLNG